MRTLVVTEFITLDGIVDSPGGGDHPHAGWTFKDVEFDEAAYDIKGREMLAATALLFGRQSYDEFAPVWPSMDEFETYNAMPKYVVSSTLDGDTAPWGEGQVTVLHSLDDVAALKQTEGGEIHVHGSATLAQGLAAAGLVDRYHLLVFPLVLGTGKRLFGEGDKTKLALVEHAAYSNGITLQRYDVVR
jgi:dihydrofolate reductase